MAVVPDSKSGCCGFESRPVYHIVEQQMYKVILETVVGSTVHGVAVKDGLEDLDLMAVVVEDPPQILGLLPKDVWVFRTKPEGVRSEAGDTDWVGYGLRKYLRLVLAGNPSAMLPLFVPDMYVRVNTDSGKELRALAPKIVSKAAYPAYRGYMNQQLERLLGKRGQKNVTRPELVEAYGYDTKYAGHIARLGYQGAEFMRTGKVTLPMPEAERQVCLDVRTGKYTLPEFIELATEIDLGLERAGHESQLPEAPDTAAVEQWMLATYLKHWA